MFARTLPAALALAIAFACTGATAGAPRLDDTGIDYCIDADSDFTDCEGTGQDAAYGRDVTNPKGRNGRLGFSFTKLCNSGQRAGQGGCPPKPKPGDAPAQWGCTHDEVTGLTWETKTRSGHRAGSRMYTFYTPEYDPEGTYGSATDLTGFVDSVNEKGLCGASDWRLPMPVELMGIVDMSFIPVPAIDARFFPNTAPNFYWGAGTTLGFFFEKELAWGSDFFFGLGDITAQFRSGARPVRLVRGGEHGGKRFVISADQQEVADRHTGLAWRRCLEGQTYDGERCAGEPLMVDWQATLAHALKQAHDTGVAWRLPNVKELASLLDHERLPHVDEKAFPGAGGDVLWTSSSFPTDPTPRCVDFPDGITFSCSQGGGGGGFGSRLVR